MSKPRGWLQLLRVPNLFTVPGDPAGGFLLAMAAGADGPWWRLAPAAGASVLLYCAGLIANDVLDLSEDRRDRPTRPLPSGAVSVHAAGLAFVVCLLSGAALAFLAGRAALLMAAALVAAIMLYNSVLKHHATLGPAAMGACRGLSVLLGACAAGSWAALTMPTVVVTALGTAAYIAAVTVIARGETAPGGLGIRAWLPTLAALGWFGALCAAAVMTMPTAITDIASLPTLGVLMSAAFAFSGIGMTAQCGLQLSRADSPAAVQRLVGALIRTLVRLQTAVAVVLLWPGVIAVAVLLAFWYAASWLGQRFYSS
jgi:4-hydroxybenzoate polyprenyltransferase